MANKLSYRDIWVSKVSERLQARDGYAGIVKQIESTGGRHVLWEKLHNPSSPIETDLSFAINIGCVFPTNPYVSIFLGWAKESAGMALNDVRFYIDPDEQRGLIGWKVKGVYPGTHGKTLAAACIVNAMHHDNELDAVLVMRACGEIAESALVGGSSTWDYIAQSEYLRCVRLALICGELDKAQYFLKNIRRKFKNTFLHHELLEHITNTLTSSSENGMNPLLHFKTILIWYVIPITNFLLMKWEGAT